MSLMVNDHTSKNPIIPAFDHHLRGYHEQNYPQRMSPQRANFSRKIFRRVVANQREKFDNDENFKKLSIEREQVSIAFTNRAASHDEKTLELKKGLLDGELILGFTGIGTHILFTFAKNESGQNYHKEKGKVYLKSNPSLYNGVSIKFNGHLDLSTFTGIGCIEFDEQHARLEESHYDSRQAQAGFRRADRSRTHSTHFQPYTNPFQTMPQQTQIKAELDYF